MRGKLTLFALQRIGLPAGFGGGRDVRSIALVLAPVQLVIALAICSAMELEGLPQPPWPSLRSMAGEAMISMISAMWMVLTFL